MIDPMPSDDIVEVRSIRRQQLLDIMIKMKGKWLPAVRLMQKFGHRLGSDIQVLRRSGWLIDSRIIEDSNVAEYCLISSRRSCPIDQVQRKKARIYLQIKNFLESKYKESVSWEDPDLLKLVNKIWDGSHTALYSVSRWTPERVADQEMLWEFLERKGFTVHYIDYQPTANKWAVKMEASTYVGQPKIKYFSQDTIEEIRKKLRRQKDESPQETCA